MTRINLSEFRDYSGKALYEFLLYVDDSDFQVTIPRTTSFDEENRIGIVIDFSNAAYAGQLLYEIANTFAYYVPSPYNTNDFFFDISVTELEKFAEVLHKLVRGYDYKEDDREFLDYQVLAADFIAEAYDDSVKCRTWGLVEIANEFLEEEE